MSPHMTPTIFIGLNNTPSVTSHPLGGTEYIHNHPYSAIPFLTITSLACLSGTLGNLMVLLAVAVNRQLRTHSGTLFVVNLAFSDLVVTTTGDTFSIVGMVAGKQYFTMRPYLCDIVTTICLVACVVSLFSIGGISFNRYIVICDIECCKWLLSRRNIILTCILFWILGTILSLPALVGWTENIYDHKLLECFWNRLHSLSFTIFFSAGIVFTPIMVISFSFINIYLHVRASRLRISKDQGDHGRSSKIRKAINQRSIHLATALFIIFSVFVVCWVPYSLLILIDTEDKLPHEVYLFTLLLAHMHSSLNWLVYAITHAHFRKGYCMVLNAITCGLLFNSTHRRPGATGFSIAPSGEGLPLKASPNMDSNSPCMNTLLRHDRVNKGCIYTEEQHYNHNTDI